MTALETVPAVGVIPFVVMLLVIAILPLFSFTGRRWEDWRFQLTICLALGLPVAVYMLLHFGLLPLGLTVFEYFQFISLLGALYIISGGLFLDGDIRATPRNNAILLGVGGVLASIIGTTGAVMLMIRPLLNINAERRRRAHSVIFLILIVANNAGMLSPLGDPPLFLGFLRGVPFTWTLQLWPQWLFVNLMLMALYVGLDTSEYAKETVTDRLLDAVFIKPIRILGAVNFVFFAMIIVAVAVVPSFNLAAIEAGSPAWFDYVPWRETVFVLACAGSFIFGEKRIRRELNQFSWAPIREVAVLFVGIYLTMMPALRFLAQITPKLPLNEVNVFVFSGTLSAFLDSAPAYVAFFEMVAQLPGQPRVAGVPESYLIALSLGTVTCGALTYLGNGPHFMVKAVAESYGVQMPSFGGYMAWTARYLLPTLVATVCIFVARPRWAHLLGLGVAVSVIFEAVWLYLRARSEAKVVYNLIGSRAGIGGD